jgi:PAS domain S-box-containing protein
MLSTKETSSASKPTLPFLAVEHSQLTLAALEKTFPQLLFSTDKAGAITFANQAFQKFIGRSLNGLLDQNISNFIEKKIVGSGEEKSDKKLIAPFFEKFIESINEGNESKIIELALLNKDGVSETFATSITEIFVKNELTGFLFVASNFIEPRKDENVSKADEKFKLLTENIPGTIYLCKNDAFFTPLYLNNHVETLVGYTATEFISGAVNFVQLYHPEDTKMIFEAVEKALEEKTSFNLQYRIKHKNGIYKWVGEVGIGLYEAGELVMLEGYLNDITEKKNAEDEIRQSRRNLELAADSLQKQNDQLNDFAYILSHNLRSPVGNISALISLLSEKSTIEEYRTIFDNLKHTASSLQDTLNDLMETLKIKEDTEIQKDRLSFQDCLNKVQQDLAGEIIKAEAVILRDFSGCPDIAYPKAYLESIFLNLLSNSIKYRSTNRKLVVNFTSFRKGEKNYLSISDNGKGIDLTKYGDALFGLHKTFHNHPEAKGVGLFLTKTQIETLGGSISAISKLDQGTTFTIQF